MRHQENRGNGVHGMSDRVRFHGHGADQRGQILHGGIEGLQRHPVVRPGAGHVSDDRLGLPGRRGAQWQDLRQVPGNGEAQRQSRRAARRQLQGRRRGHADAASPRRASTSTARRRKVADLERGYELNFYIAEDRLAAQFPETEVQTARLVVVPIVVHEQPERMASLPSTAGPLPLLALGGMLTLGFGGLLTLYRRRR